MRQVIWLESDPATGIRIGPCRDGGHTSRAGSPAAPSSRAGVQGAPRAPRHWSEGVQGNRNGSPGRRRHVRIPAHANHDSRACPSGGPGSTEHLSGARSTPDEARNTGPAGRSSYARHDGVGPPSRPLLLKRSVGVHLCNLQALPCRHWSDETNLHEHLAYQVIAALGGLGSDGAPDDRSVMSVIARTTPSTTFPSSGSGT